MNSDSSATPPQHSGPDQAKRKFPIWLSGVLLVTVVLISSIGYLRSFWHGGGADVDQSDDNQDVSATNEERRVAPVIQVASDKGQNTKLSEYKGKVVLLSFWASWCGPCLEELPTFAQLSKKYQAQGFEVFAVNVDESISDAKAFIGDFWKNKAIPFPTFFDNGLAASRAFNIEVLPANFLIDRSGRIAYTGYGASDWTSDEINDTIDELLKEIAK